MLTNLKRQIKTDSDAVEFLNELWRNGEDFHPEDDAHDIRWSRTTAPTELECDQLNSLMEQIYSNTDVDPCEILLDLINQK